MYRIVINKGFYHYLLMFYKQCSKLYFNNFRPLTCFQSDYTTWALSFDNEVLFRLYVGLHSQDFPETPHIPLPVNALQAI